MTAYSTKGLAIRLEKAPTSRLTLVPTAITKARPAVVTVASTTGVSTGDAIKVINTGFAELDGKYFAAANVTGTTFQLYGSDTIGSSGTLAGSPSVSVTQAVDFVQLCLSDLSIEPSSTNQIDASTFCADQTVLGKTTLGGISFSGYIDKTDMGAEELMKASDDGIARVFKVTLNNDQGFYIGAVTVAGFSPTTPIEGAMAFTATGSQSDKIRWIHD